MLYQLSYYRIVVLCRAAGWRLQKLSFLRDGAIDDLGDAVAVSGLIVTHREGVID